MRYMTLAMTMVVGLFLAGCTMNMDRPHLSIAERCALNPMNSFDPNLCNENTDDNH